MGPYDTGVVKTLPPLEALPEDPELAALYAAVLAHRHGSKAQPALPASTESAWAYHARAQGLRNR